ncbi:MAG: NfeD family protein [Prolixibacteraceae bacterium]|jgi:membrane protein implicated in regulation of membrane protease activity|nr:NfeD family protein [Prolixibacteraceae bacterium]
MEFEIWHIWLMAAILLFILEIFLPSFVVFNFGIGALIATGAAALGMNIQWQVFIFSLFTLASFFTVRPMLVKWAYQRSDKKETNMNAMIGRIGVVTEQIAPNQNTGRISVDGDDWKAQSVNQEIIELKTPVRVVKVESIVMIVEKAIKD